MQLGGDVYFCVDDLVLLPAFGVDCASSELSESVELSAGHSLFWVGEVAPDAVGVEWTGLEIDCVRTELVDRSSAEMIGAVGTKSARSFTTGAQGVFKRGVEGRPPTLPNGLFKLAASLAGLNGNS